VCMGGSEPDAGGRQRIQPRGDRGGVPVRPKRIGSKGVDGNQDDTSEPPIQMRFFGFR